MNDYAFGNELCRLRREAGLSQSALGQLLDVSNKAVSKWETGKAKPTTDTLRKLSAIFHISIDTLLCLRPRSAG